MMVWVWIEAHSGAVRGSGRSPDLAVPKGLYREQRPGDTVSERDASRGAVRPGIALVMRNRPTTLEGRIGVVIEEL